MYCMLTGWHNALVRSRDFEAKLNQSKPLFVTRASFMAVYFTSCQRLTCLHQTTCLMFMEVAKCTFDGVTCNNNRSKILK